MLKILLIYLSVNNGYDDIIFAHQIGVSAVFTHMRKVNLTYLVQTHWKDKNRTAAQRKTSDVIDMLK